MRTRHRSALLLTAAVLGASLAASGAAPALAAPARAAAPTPAAGSAPSSAPSGAAASTALVSGRVGTVSVVLSAGDPADVYYPVVPDRLRGLLTDAFPVVAVLQGANVDKRFYSGLGRQLARQGFVVVVPNRARIVGPPVPQLFTSTTAITEVLDYARQADVDPASPVYRVTDAGSLGLVGHSFGGAVGLFASAGVCQPPLCEPPFVRPKELRAAAFYGTNVATGEVLDRDLDTSGVAVALVQGTRDTIAPPVEALVTYRSLERPRALITIEGANHYGITDVDDPEGAVPDPADPTIGQQQSVRLVARWSGLWLRAGLKNDPVARALLELRERFPAGPVRVLVED